MRRKSRPPMTRMEAWILVVTGFLMGTVFTFGMQYWNAPVAERDAIHKTIVFSSYAVHYKNSSPNEIIMRWENYEQLYIERVSITKELLDGLSAVNRGDELAVAIHPNISTILALQHGERVLLDFDSTIQKRSNEATAFLSLGILCYGFGLAGLWTLIGHKK